MGKMLDYGVGHFAIFPPCIGEGHDDYWLYIAKDCPPDIRERLEHDWPIAKKETEDRHVNGIWDSSKDYF